MPEQDLINKLHFFPVKWDSDALIILDQRLLPEKEEYRRLTAVEQVVEAIINLSVRGAPLIGIAAAYGLCLLKDPGDDNRFLSARTTMKNARPTAVNLAWAVDRMMDILQANAGKSDIRQILIDEALAIHTEDARMCADIGQNGNLLLPAECNVLTHCNTGALATGGIGTALGIVYTAHHSGKKVHVWVDETRPVLQGARLTAWELSKAGIPYTLIADNMAAVLMAQGKVDIVITGADRVAKNFDFANKIGTYNLAVISNYHHIPFYAAAPSSTFDPYCTDGHCIDIENRSGDEIRRIGGQLIAPMGADVFNPAFDITPHELIWGIVTEKGILKPSK